MTTFELKAKFERLGPTRAIDPVPSGSREIVAIRRNPETERPDSVAAILLLRRSGLSMLRAKRSIESVFVDGETFIEIPRMADASAFEAALGRSGFLARVRSREAPNVQSLRERLGLTQEQFAARFGLEVDAIRNWESHRRAPDPAARSLLRVIARFPDLVAEAQNG